MSRNNPESEISISELPLYAERLPDEEPGLSKQQKTSIVGGFIAESAGAWMTLNASDKTTLCLGAIAASVGLGVIVINVLKPAGE